MTWASGAGCWGAGGWGAVGWGAVGWGAWAVCRVAVCRVEVRPARRWAPAFWAGGELSAAPALDALARPADDLVPAVPAVPAVPTRLAEVMFAVMPTGGASCPGALPSCAAR